MDKFRGCLLGLACGDAVGTTVEFQPRGTFKPVTDMIGSGPFRLKAGEGKEEILIGRQVATIESNEIRAVARGEHRTNTEDQIRGSGYVAASLEAAPWCFDRSDSFEEAILKAANLGDDADTTVAVCGQIAGSCYGEEGIQPKWLERLVMADKIRDMADRGVTSYIPPSPI